MKCLDKKRIKMKQGETLALNERIMLSLVSTGVCVYHYLFFSLPAFFMASSFVVKEEGCPFIVCMAYAFHTTDKLCFILDLMNGKQTFFKKKEKGNSLFSFVNI